MSLASDCMSALSADVSGIAHLLDRRVVERLDAIVERHQAIFPGHVPLRAEIVEHILKTDVRSVVLDQTKLRRKRDRDGQVELQVPSSRLLSFAQDTAK